MKFSKITPVFIFLAAGVVFYAAGSSPAHASRNAVPSFFNSKETRSSNLKPFKKWTNALKRFSKEKAAQAKGNCKSTKFNKCYYDAWMRFLKKLKNKTPIEKIKAVNTRMNKARYITDPVNWGMKDYWESPAEFFSRFGDCEDYAIVKYLSLRMLGIRNDQMRVVALKDLNLKIGHAVLVVYLDGKILLLDNQIKEVIETKQVRHYQPVFSINAKYWWRHRV